MYNLHVHTNMLLLKVVLWVYYTKLCTLTCWTGTWIDISWFLLKPSFSVYKHMNVYNFHILQTVYTEAHASIHSNGTNQVVSGNLTLIKWVLDPVCPILPDPCRFEMSLVSTTIGSFSVGLLQATVNGVVNVFVLPLANRELSIYMWEIISF